MKYDIQELYPCHLVITGLSGKLGIYVFYMQSGRIYARKYIILSNPRTVRQQTWRTRFAGMIQRWRSQVETARAEWNARAVKNRRSGYNLFISVHMRHADTATLLRAVFSKPAHSILHTPAPALMPLCVATRDESGPRHNSRAPSEIRVA